MKTSSEGRKLRKGMQTDSANVDNYLRSSCHARQDVETDCSRYQNKEASIVLMYSCMSRQSPHTRPDLAAHR